MSIIKKYKSLIKKDTTLKLKQKSLISRINVLTTERKIFRKHKAKFNTMLFNGETFVNTKFLDSNTNNISTNTVLISLVLKDLKNVKQQLKENNAKLSLLIYFNSKD